MGELPPIPHIIQDRLPGDTLHESLAIGLEGLLSTMANCRQEIARIETEIAEQEREYQSDIALYSADDLKDQAALERRKTLHDGYVATLRDAIANTQGMIASLEETHKAGAKKLAELLAAEVPTKTDATSTGI